MKLPLGITIALLLILQTFQQVSTQIPDGWKRNGTVDDNGQQTSVEKTTAQPVGGSEGDSESSSENDVQSFGSIYFSDEGEQNFTKPLNQTHEQSDTEEASSDGSVPTTPPPMIAPNSSSELSDTSAESNETFTQNTNTSTPEPEHSNESALNDTYTSPQPETTTTESSHDGSGSGDLPSDDVPTNSTTTSPTTTTKDESVQNETTVSPTEPPVQDTTTAIIPPVVPEDQTTLAPNSEDTDANLTGPIDNRDNSQRDVSDAKESKKGQAWTIAILLLVIGIVVGILALGAFIILNRRNRRDFSHRKLVEEMSPDPVLRLDNSEPLDLKFDGFGYYNPGLQRDNIQMTNFPQGSSK
ncbi:mucin-15-like protein [Labeo rohita]|uniref:Mucin-15-like protein n=1 Tax=Labeo rohita TaxID=84645 RepID=A0A498MIZ8_LABRO|nr:mucin-15-like protein [Labeo rohita]